MKTLVTRKSIKECNNTIVAIGYCNAQFMLEYRQPFAYSARAEGWACDYYHVNGAIISTGYAPVGNIRPDYDLIKQYDDKAMKISGDYNLNYDERKKKVEELLEAFVEEVTSK